MGRAPFSDEAAVNRSLELIDLLMQEETPGTPIYEAAKELRERIVAITSYRRPADAD